MARLEGRVEELSKRIDDLRSDMNARLSELRNDMNHRLAELCERISRLEARVDLLSDKLDRNFRWTVGMLLGVWATVVCTLVPLLLKLLGAI